MGLGGGIVADSDSSREWDEIADKGRFLCNLPAPFQLIETFLLDRDGHLPRLEQHLHRLQMSARSLGFSCDRQEIESTVRHQAARWHEEGLGARIIRLLLQTSGVVDMQQRPCPLFAQQLTVHIAAYCVDRLDRLLRHKTTRRQRFDHALSMAMTAGADVALFANNLGHVTEGAIRAILVRLGKQWYAPPLQDGLLASIWRAEQMARLRVLEKSLTLEDLLAADEVMMGNSVQGGARVIRLSDASGKRLATW